MTGPGGPASHARRERPAAQGDIVAGATHNPIARRADDLEKEKTVMDEVVIVGAVRTAVGKFGGALAKVPAPQLGATVIRALLQRTGVEPGMVSEVLLGQVLTAGSGQNPAR
jgi:acetyl-CoA C-acetyltransferase